jgi:hypothetical protein
MTTNADNTGAASTVGKASYPADQRFFVRLAVGLAALVVVAFAQFAAQGFANYRTAPIWVHIHGIAMLSWVGLFVFQNHLANRGSLALHRKLGWTALGLALLLTVIGTFTVVKAVELHRVPPFFSNPYFLALGPLGLVFFLGTLLCAIRLRRDTEWHRRLMFVAMIIILEPAFGRLLPMPLLGAFGPWLEMALQLGVLAILMRHDRVVRGSVHPALWWGAGLIVAFYVCLHMLTAFAPFAAFAESLAR